MLDSSEIRKIFAQAKNKEEVGTQLLRDWAKRDLKGFMNIFRQDYANKVDWSQGYELMDASVALYVSKLELKRKNTFYLLVKATNTKGKPFRFMLSTTLILKRGQAKVGVADMPLEDPVVTAAPQTEMSEEEIMDTFIQRMQAQMAAGEKPARADDSPNCSRCGRSDLPLTIAIEARSLKTEKICPICMGNGSLNQQPPKQKSLTEIDQSIAEYEELALVYEDLIRKHPDSEDNIDPTLAKYAMTPQNNYRTIQAMLADLKSQRMQALTAMGSEARLQYELEKAIAAEDFEKSAELRDRILVTRD